ncbi:hypothetical protein ABZ419_03045 [Streptomyces cinnamoneus]|uniref:hypothetical protein n=1 Tax=Streptomyces cinnamoneus TaxID=53446 RepID=UPI0033E36A85
MTDLLMAPLACPETDRFHTALHGKVPDAEVEALRAATILDPELRIALTLVSLGPSYTQVAAMLGIQKHTLQYLLIRAGKALREPGRTSAVLHTAYLHPGFPLPCPREGDRTERPELTDGERLLLEAHASGVTQTTLRDTLNRGLKELRAFNRGLFDKLDADNPSHCVRRAWELGIYTRENGPAVPTGATSGTSRLGLDSDGAKPSCLSANPNGTPAGNTAAPSAG